MKKTVWLLPFFLFIFSSCQDKEARAELEALKAQTELEEQNKELVQSYIDAWNGFDLSVLGECLGESFKVYIPLRIRGILEAFRLPGFRSREVPLKSSALMQQLGLALTADNSSD